MTLINLEKIIIDNLKDKNNSFKRVFHGRGDFYGDYSFLTVDSIDDILYVCFFEQINQDLENNLLKIFYKIFEEFNFSTLILQRRYLPKSPCEVLKGKLKEENYLVEDNLKYQINFNNRNIGIFCDMQIGREYVKSCVKNKKVLNLFSYTCAFSVAAHCGGASKIVNVDMSKSALSQGRANHHLNNQDTKIVQFMPYNILKSWSRIKKAGPYDFIIIDPPSFQKGSFAASKDYEKIIKKLKELASQDCEILSCLNAPELDSSFIKNLFLEHANEFEFVKNLENPHTYPSKNKEKALKNMIFKRIKT